MRDISRGDACIRKHNCDCCVGVMSMTSTEPYPVVIIHPSCIFAEALGQLLHQTPFKIERIATEINSVPLDVLSRTALFLVGGRTPDHVVELVRDIRQRLHSPTIVVIGGAKEPEVVMRALGAGANAYLREDMTSQTLIIALQLVMQEETVLPSVAAKCLLARIMHGAAEVASGSLPPWQFPGFGHTKARRFESGGQQAEFGVERDGIIRGHRRPGV